jgi:chromosome segregation ATPase
LDTGVSRQQSAVSDQQRKEKLVSACNAVADELRASRILIDALETENSALRSRLETERSATRLLNELNDTRRAESEALKATVTAKNETIAAKDSAIAEQDKLIGSLKTKKRSVWSRIADIAIGAAIGTVIK